MIFKAENFANKASNDANRFGYIIQVSDAVETANRILDSYIATLPVVYCKQDPFFHLNTTFMKVVDKKEDATHEALLWDVKEIEKKKCEHLHLRAFNRDLNEAECADCEIKVKATWSPA